MTIVENPCHASGCFGHCCQDLLMEISTAQQRRVFPGAQPVRLDELSSLPTDQEGVFTAFKGYIGTVCFAYVRVIGRCPHLKEDGNCNCWEDRTDACRNFDVGCSECNDIRGFHSLSRLKV